MMTSRIRTLTLLVILATECIISQSFSIVMMGMKRRKGGLKKGLESTESTSKSISGLNQGKGQEITGVSLPTEG